jgi:hypothetical protein
MFLLGAAPTGRTLDPIIATALAGAVPTLAIIAAFIRNETALVSINDRIDTLGKE